ncbi:SDR family oxidoreductase [Streptomyces sp. NPDC003042]
MPSRRPSPPSADWTPPSTTRARRHHRQQQQHRGPRGHHSPCIASKHAVRGLTKAAASEYAAQGIRVNAIAIAIAPGTTPRFRPPSPYRGPRGDRRGRGLAVQRPRLLVVGTALSVDGRLDHPLTAVGRRRR